MTQITEHIPYYPNREQYEVRLQYHLQKPAVAGSLPYGFPEKLNSEMVWEGQNVSFDKPGVDGGAPYLVTLNNTQLVEIEAALRYFQTLNKPLETLDPSTFPLPCLHPVLQSVSENLHSGYGFTLIRGVQVDQYTPWENMAISVGLSSHIGVIRGRQDHQYDGLPADVMIAHITDMRRSSEDEKSFALAAYSDGEVIFHTDVGDIVSLFALGEPASGGESLLASGWRVYNELAATRPDLVKVLAEDWPIPSTKKPGLLHHRPLLYYQSKSDDSPERVIFQFSRRSFSGFGTHSQVDLLTPLQVEALDALHFLAERFQLAMTLQKGDMQFINNLSIFHARRSYLDDAEHRRHLLRLWLRDPQRSWETPNSLRSRWDRIYDQRAMNSHGPQIFPVDPIPRSVGRPERTKTNMQDAPVAVY